MLFNTDLKTWGRGIVIAAIIMSLIGVFSLENATAAYFVLICGIPGAIGMIFLFIDALNKATKKDK